jgi:hypothetical protein
MITNTCFNGGTRSDGPLWLVLATGPALTAIGPTTAPRPNATATATAQAGKRDIRLTEDQICRVTAYLLLVVCCGTRRDRRRTSQGLKRFSPAAGPQLPFTARKSGPRKTAKSTQPRR